jgi:hypothetical protein
VIKFNCSQPTKIEFHFLNHRVEASVDGRVRGHDENLWDLAEAALSQIPPQSKCAREMCESRSHQGGGCERTERVIGLARRNKPGTQLITLVEPRIRAIFEMTEQQRRQAFRI